MYAYVVITDGGNRTDTYNNYDCQNFQQVVTGVPVHIKYVFSGYPKLSNWVSCECTDSPSLKGVGRKTAE